MDREEINNIKLKNIVHGILVIFISCIVFLSFIMTVKQNEANIMIGNTTIFVPKCTFLETFGIRCPACGLSRGYIYIAHGMFKEAWAMNRMSIVLYMYSVIQLIYSIFFLITKGKYEKDILYIVPVSIALLLIINWILYFI